MHNEGVNASGLCSKKKGHTCTTRGKMPAAYAARRRGAHAQQGGKHQRLMQQEEGAHMHNKGFMPAANTTRRRGAHAQQGVYASG